MGLGTLQQRRTATPTESHVLQREFHAGPALVPRSNTEFHGLERAGPARSVHWPSDFGAPTMSWACDNSNSRRIPDLSYPVDFCGRRGTSGPSVYAVPPPFQHYPHTSSDPSLPPSSPICGRYRNPFDISPPPTIMSPPPTLRPSPPLSPVPSPSQTESVVGSIHRTSLSPITERTSPSSTVPPPPPFGRPRTGRPRVHPQSIHSQHPPDPASQPLSSCRAAFQYRRDQNSPVSNRCCRIGLIWVTHAICCRYCRTII